MSAAAILAALKPSMSESDFTRFRLLLTSGAAGPQAEQRRLVGEQAAKSLSGTAALVFMEKFCDLQAASLGYTASAFCGVR